MDAPQRPVGQTEPPGACRSNPSQIIARQHSAAVRNSDFRFTFALTGACARAPRALAGGEPAENAAATLAILQGEGQDAHKAAVAVNVAAMLKIAGLGDNLKVNTQAVLELLSSNKAFTTLSHFKQLSQQQETNHG